jgi:hypothetical protein
MITILSYVPYFQAKAIYDIITTVCLLGLLIAVGGFSRNLF